MAANKKQQESLGLFPEMGLFDLKDEKKSLGEKLVEIRNENRFFEEKVYADNQSKKEFNQEVKKCRINTVFRWNRR